MGRPKKDEKDKKIKVSVSMNRQLLKLIKDDGLKPSRIINRLVEEYYGNKNLY